MYDPAEEEARAERTARQQAEDFKKAMKKIRVERKRQTLRAGKLRCKHAVIHADFNLKGKRK